MASDRQAVRFVRSARYCRWRVEGRTIMSSGMVVGIMESPDLARLVASDHNNMLARTPRH